MQAFYKAVIQFVIIHQCFFLINGSFPNYLAFLGHSDNPCNDFYQYACKNYSRDNPDNTYNEIIQKLDYEMNVLLLKRMKYLETRYNYNDYIFNYLKSCKNEKQRNLTKYLEEIKSPDGLNWSLMEEFKENEWLEEHTKFDIWSLMGKLQSYGLNNAIVTPSFIRNDDDTLEIILKPAENIQGREGILIDKPVLESLLKGLNVQDINRHFKELQQTQLEWQQIIESNTNSSVIMEIPFFKDLDLLYPNLNLTGYLKQLLSSNDIENINLITIESPEFFQYLNDKIWSKREQQQLGNYLMIKFLYYLSEDSVAEFTPLECMKDLKNKLELAVNIFYYNRFFQHWSAAYIKPLESILNATKATLEKIFEENRLDLNATQVQFLKDKLAAIKINIGNLPSNCTNHTLEEYYKDLPALSTENYYKNLLLLLKHRFSKSLLNEAKQTHYIFTTNHMGRMPSPYYVPHKNMVVIPFEILQKSFFHSTQTALEQIANFGFVLVHELAHAFDTIGLQLDRNGLFLRQPLSIKENENFIKSLTCMQNQQLTDAIDERIADLLAVQVVYRTYEDRVHEDSCANCPANWKQSFFISLAQFFCGKDNLDFYDHDADSTRLQQIVKNFPAFSQAFECRRGSPMNPTEKCRLY